MTSNLCGEVISDYGVFCQAVEIRLTCVAPTERAVSIFLPLIPCAYLLEPGHHSLECQTRPDECGQRSGRSRDCPG